MSIHELLHCAMFKWVVFNETRFSCLDVFRDFVNNGTQGQYYTNFFAYRVKDSGLYMV